MAFLRRFGQALGDSASTLGTGLEENQKLNMEYGLRAQEQAQAQANAEADRQQRLALAQQARADAEHQFAAVHPDLTKDPTTGAYRPATPTENPQPFISGISEAKTPDDIQTFLQQFQAKTGKPAWQLMQGGQGGVPPADPDAALFQKLGTMANSRQTNLADQLKRNTAQAAATTGATETARLGAETSPAAIAGAAAKTGALSDAGWPGDKRKLDYEDVLRQRDEERKAKLAADKAKQASTKGVTLADIQLGQVLDAWNKANPEGVGSMGTIGRVTQGAHRAIQAHEPAFLQSVLNPAVTQYNSVRNSAEPSLGLAFSGGGSRGAALAKLMSGSLPEFGTDPNVGRQQIQKLRETIRYYPLASQVADQTGEDAYELMQRWQKLGSMIPRDNRGNPVVKQFKDPETGLMIPVGGS